MIIVVHGPPAAGKTTLAESISAHLSLPHISRDKITEWLMDSGQIEHDRYFPFIGNAGYELMFRMTQEISKGNSDFIVEGSLNPEGSKARLEKTLGSRSGEVFEIFISAPNEILIERYRKRAADPKRHRGHNDVQKAKNIREHLDRTKYRPMGFTDLLELNGALDIDLVLSQALNEIGALPRD